MASISLQGQGDIAEIAGLLEEGVVSSGLSCELIDSVVRRVGQDTTTILLVFEKYYMRSSNRASLSIMLTQDGSTVYLDAVSAGGGQGALFRFSWGAEESFVSIVPSILRGKGFA
jgi:hypothetical protein